MKTIMKRAFAAGLGLLLSCVVWAGLETGTYISDLVATNPLTSDLAATGDDHLRLLKSTIKATFPNINGAVSATDENLSLLTGLSGTVWTSANDGASSTLDADLLDGNSSASYAQLSASNVFTGSVQTLQRSATPRWLWISLDGGTNEDVWELRANGSGQFLGMTRTDADGAGATWLTVDRTGTTVDSVNLAATAVQTNGEDITGSTGTFTCTGTGFSGADPTVTCRYVKRGNVVTLRIPQITGTSDATTFTITGLPAAIDGTTEQFCNARVVDNLVAGVVVGATGISIGSGTTAQVYWDGGTTFTNSGTKQLGNSFADTVCTYVLN